MCCGRREVLQPSGGAGRRIRGRVDSKPAKWQNIRSVQADGAASGGIFGAFYRPAFSTQLRTAIGISQFVHTVELLGLGDRAAPKKPDVLREVKAQQTCGSWGCWGLMRSKLGLAELCPHNWRGLHSRDGRDFTEETFPRPRGKNSGCEAGDTQLLNPHRVYGRMRGTPRTGGPQPNCKFGNAELGAGRQSDQGRDRSSSNPVGENRGRRTGRTNPAGRNNSTLRPS